MVAVPRAERNKCVTIPSLEKPRNGGAPQTMGNHLVEVSMDAKTNGTTCLFDVPSKCVSTQVDIFLENVFFVRLSAVYGEKDLSSGPLSLHTISK